MRETHKTLTAVQRKQLTTAIETVQDARAVLDKADKAAQSVYTLILDAHGLSESDKVRLDMENGVLLVFTEELVGGSSEAVSAPLPQDPA